VIVEVVVGRRPEVFVRPVSMEEGRRLQRISRTAKDPVKLRRAERRHRRLPALAQCPRRTEERLRPRLTHPHLDPIPAKPA
jgi:hypothetical protein